MITDYMIVRTTDAAEMAKQVRAGIAQGWQLYGELHIMAISPYVTFTQQMVKYAAEKAEPESFKDTYRRIGDMARDAGLI